MAAFFPLHFKENTQNWFMQSFLTLYHFLLIATGLVFFISSQLSFTKINPINYVFPFSYIISQAGK